MKLRVKEPSEGCQPRVRAGPAMGARVRADISSLQREGLRDKRGQCNESESDRLRGNTRESPHATQAASRTHLDSRRKELVGDFFISWPMAFARSHIDHRGREEFVDRGVAAQSSTVPSPLSSESAYTHAHYHAIVGLVGDEGPALLRNGTLSCNAGVEGVAVSRGSFVRRGACAYQGAASPARAGTHPTRHRLSSTASSRRGRR